MVRSGAAWMAAVVATALAWSALADRASAQTPGAGATSAKMTLLGEGTYWRYYVTFGRVDGSEPRNPLALTGRWVGVFEGLVSLPPDAAWTGPEFDDTGWPRRRGGVFPGYGTGRSAGNVRHIAARARFQVLDPARVRDLQLNLQYRGGAVVYLNGVEISRGDLPPGTLTPDTLAKAYPDTAFLLPDGSGPLPEPVKNTLAQYQQQYDQRFRTMRVALPASRLLPGVNTLAVAVHAAPWPRAGLMGRNGWDTAGLCAAELSAAPGSAVVAPPVTPPGTQIWAAEPALRVGPEDVHAGDALDPPASIRLTAPINGLASGQVVVSGPSPLGRLTATASALTGPGGAVIPASACQVRYARPVERFVPLMNVSDETAAMQPVWLTVNVPDAVAAGRYTGTLDVRLPARSVNVPVTLDVVGWKVASPRQWRTVVNLLQSPESVAGHYGVPLWSDRHFALMEKSLKLMGDCGNDVLGVSAVARSVFGNDPLIVFRRQDGKLVPEFKYLDRYLEMYHRVAGPPMFLSVQVWSYGFYQRGAGRDGGKEEMWSETIPLMEMQGNKLAVIEYPNYNKPGVEALWKQVMDGVRDRVKRLGWPERCILVGTGGDTWPHQSTVDMFKRIAPYARWRVLTHGGGAPDWGLSDDERTQPNGMVVGYLEIARRIQSDRDRVPGAPVVCNARDMVGGIDPFLFISLPILNTTAANFEGFCWKGLDYWSFTEADGTKRSALNTYVRFGNMVGSTPRTLLHPGPDGAVATVQYEMLREGIQASEALMVIRQALAGDTTRRLLGAELKARCERLVVELPATIECGHRGGPQGSTDLRRLFRDLYNTAAAVAAVIPPEQLPPPRAIAADPMPYDGVSPRRYNRGRVNGDAGADEP